MEKIRLQKILAGAFSRRKADECIAAGRVTVNGVVAVPGTKADPSADEILLDGRPVTEKSAPVYLMLHKPTRYITTAHDPQGRPTVFDLLPPGTRCFSVGRLDYDTSGLLLLTNDGDFAFRVTHPSHEVNKIYIARLRGIPAEDALRAFRAGVSVDGVPTAPAGIEIIKKERDARVRITLSEGRNRQVRKMCEAIGHPVIALKRVAVGGLHLGDLPVGQWRSISPREANRCFSD